MKCNGLLDGCVLFSKQKSYVGKFRRGQVMLGRIAEVNVVLMSGSDSDLDVLVRLAKRYNFAAMFGRMLIVPRMPAIRPVRCLHPERND